MMNNNKILTVSYGTFSCTLEGFEDSFGTMKVIAEYFRDLAADDRYFGAEPPQPDAETLAQIAQQEVARRVEAREQDGRIVLSALENSAAPVAGAAALVAASDLAEPEAEEVALDKPSEDIADEAEVSVEEVAEDEAPEIAVTTDDMAEPVEAADDTDAPVIEDVEDVDAVATDADVALEEVTSDTEIEEIEEVEDTVAEEAPEELVAEDASDEPLAASEDEAEATETEEVEAAEVEEEVEASETEEAAEAEAAATPDVEEDEQVEAAQEDEVEDADAASEEEENAEAVTEAAAEDEDTTDIVPGTPDAEVSAFFAGSPSEDVAEAEEMDEAVADASSDNPAPESIAAKLQRIRDVVARHDNRDADSDYVEDQHAQSEAAAESAEMEIADAPEADAEETSEVVADARADIEEALNIDEAADAEAAEANEKAHQTDDIDPILSRLDAKASEVEAEMEAVDEEEEAVEEEAVEAISDSEEDEAATVEETAEDVAEAVNNIFDDGQAKADADASETASEEFAADGSDETVTPLRVKTRRVRTRVIKVKRDDLEAAIEEGALEEYDAAAANAESKPEADAPKALDDMAPASSSETELSEGDKQELAAELAAVEQEMDDAAAEKPKRVQTKGSEVAEVEEQIFDEEDAPRRVVTSRGLLPNLEEKSGSAVNRLLEETDHQMDEPESATRRDAFAHLRAAVAAKKADDSINGNRGYDGDDVYREDLAEVVRPRRPVSGEPQTERPTSEPRPAPLKLVAEQRIPSRDASKDEPVQPRRVTSKRESVATDGQDSAFAKYAKDAGAKTLPQLLEAAAAFMCFVEGREQFSRPQLMTKVREAGGPDGFSREDGLRSFGQLLRAGKIEKLKGGRFTVSEDIGFRPDRRAVG